MPAAIAIATPIIRVQRTAPWRTLLFLTASALALSISPHAAATEECGPAAGQLAVTCPVDPNNYPDGITYDVTDNFILNLDDGVTVDRGLLSPGAGVSLGSTAGAIINAPNVTISTLAPSSDGILASTSSSAAAVNAGGSITTAGNNSAGIHVVTGEGDIGVTSSAAITTGGEGAHGIFAQSGVFVTPTDLQASLALPSGPGGAISVTSSGAILTTGADAHGIVAISPGDVTVDAGDTAASGSGIVAVSGGTANVTVNGDVSGGTVLVVNPLLELPEDPSGPLGFATGALIAGESAQLTNNGSIGSLTDNAITAFADTTTIDNNGTITGYVRLGPGDFTFNNFASTSFDLRNFADTDGDGVRETEGVAVSDFGAGVDTFNNGPDGAVVLLNVAGATAWDSSGGFVPGGVNPAFHDITQEGVEQGVFANLETFNNAGAIIMQDALAGGSGPVAGDIIAITGGEDGPGTYVSDGGSLYLDTVLNQGGAASQSDVLMADNIALGAGGATNLFIANAGGLGAQTVDNGILVVDVGDPAASAADAFAMPDLTIVGAYQYQLYQGGDAAAGGDAADGDWYLRSNLSPTTDAYRVLPSQMIRFGRAAVGTLQQRMGNRWWRVPEQRVDRTVTDPAPPPPPPAAPREFIVYFEWDRSNLTDEAQATIRQASDYAKSGNAARIVVVGHTDTSGATDYNLALSERRAQAVSSALQEQGVAAQVIGMEWLGESQPAVQTGDGVREERNRRATIQVQVPQTAGPPPVPRTRTVTDVIPASTEIQGSGAWGRILGSHGEFNDENDDREVEEDIWLAQGGVDFLVSQDETSRLIASVSLHYGESDSDVSNASFGDVATLESTGWGISGGLTWYNENGAYVDGVLSGTWYDTDINGAGVLGSLADGNEATSWSASIEGGMRYAAGTNTYWVPQGQLIYTSTDIDSFTDQFGGEVGLDDSDSLIGRLGVAYEYNNRTTTEEGEVNRMQGYGSFNLLYEFLDAPSVTVSGVNIADEGEDLWGEFGAGLTYSFSEAWSVYAEGAYRTSFENFGDSEVLQGSLGMRYNW